MSTPSQKSVLELISERAATLLTLPGVLAIAPGVRNKDGVNLPDTSVAVVTVEKKVAPQMLAQEENLQRIVGVNNVDVVEATPLQMLFARPARHGLDADALADLESRFGYPFVPETVGVRPLRLIAEAQSLAEALAKIGYKRPPGIELAPLTGKIKLCCHASPDAGWKQLKQFLSEADHELLVGMYELTAPHIGDYIAGPVAGRVGSFKLILDEGELIGTDVKRLDRTEERHKEMFAEAFSDFQVAYAHTAGPRRTFAGYYHIKLAVTDRRAFWLSSGSWQTSNQPNLDPLGPDRNHLDLPKYNREWHLTCQHKPGSELLASYLEWDLKTAIDAEERLFFDTFSVSDMTGPIVFVAEKPQFPYEEFFPPADFEFEADSKNRVIPLLTPDYYIEEVTKFVDEAKRELLVQNQSLNVFYKEKIPDPRFTTFIELLAKKSQELSDFRLIVRDPAEYGDSRKLKRDQLAAKGFDTSKVRFQVGCHNKGFIADGRTVLVGSHNLTSDGMTANRDASLLIEHDDVAKYFRDVFMHDWKVAGLAPPAPAIKLAVPGELPPLGYRQYPLWHVMDDD